MFFRKKHDITDIYGVRSIKSSPFATKNAPDAPETGYRHSDYYHKYFRGFTEVRKINGKGRVVIERYYTKPWIVSGLSKRNYWLVRLLYACLVAVSAVLFITALLQKVPGNFTWIVALPGFLSAILLFLLIAATLFYIFVEKKMTMWDYASNTKRLKVMSLATGIGQALTALALAGFALSTGVLMGKSLACAAMLLLAACCSGTLFFMEKKMPYTEIPNNTKLPDGESHEIW